MLLEKTSKGDLAARDCLIRKYVKNCQLLVLEYLIDFPIYKQFEDDLESECFSVISKCIKSFTIGHGSFYSYWKRTAIRAMNKFVANRSNKSFIDALSLDEQFNANLSLHDVVGIYDDKPENDLLNHTFLEIINNPKNEFAEIEMRVIKLFLYGYEFKDIALLLNVRTSTVYRAFKKAVVKIGKKMRPQK